MTMAIQGVIEQLRRRRWHLDKRIAARPVGVVYEMDYDKMERMAIAIAIESVRVERDRYLWGRKVMLDEIAEHLASEECVKYLGGGSQVGKELSLWIQKKYSPSK